MVVVDFSRTMSLVYYLMKWRNPHPETPQWRQGVRATGVWGAIACRRMAHIRVDPWYRARAARRDRTSDTNSRRSYALPLSYRRWSIQHTSPGLLTRIVRGSRLLFYHKVAGLAIPCCRHRLLLGCAAQLCTWLVAGVALPRTVPHWLQLGLLP